MKKSIDEEIIVNRIGLFLDPYFSASKINWMIENVDTVKNEVRKGRAILGILDVWLLYMLTKCKSIYTDISTASRTMLFNINTLKWQEEIVDFLEYLIIRYLRLFHQRRILNIAGCLEK